MDKNQDLDRPAENFFGFTKVDVTKISYEWKIHDFRVISPNRGVYLESPQFSSSNYENVKWCISMCPSHLTKELQDFLSLYLRLESNPENLQLKTNYKFSILDKNRKKCFLNSFTYTFIKSSCGHGSIQYVLRNKIINDDYLPNDCLTIVCVI